MSRIPSRLLQILGVAMLVFGVLFAVDGLLPLRSHGPNPSWLEVAIGAGLIVIGWFIRRVARSRLQRAVERGGVDS